MRRIKFIAVVLLILSMTACQKLDQDQVSTAVDTFNKAVETTEKAQEKWNEFMDRTIQKLEEKVDEQ